jgi:hypothetical protein
MGTKDVRIDTRLNKAIWAQGVRGTPFRMRVRLARLRNEDEDSTNKLYTLVTHVTVAKVPVPHNQREIVPSFYFYGKLVFYVKLLIFGLSDLIPEINIDWYIIRITFSDCTGSTNCRLLKICPSYFTI